MIVKLRNEFNNNFTEKKYVEFLDDLNMFAGKAIPFRIAETPVFIPGILKQKLQNACEYIIDFLISPGYKQLSERAIPKEMFVPGDEEKPLWLAFDFAICYDAQNQPEPQLIEMQGFPSLFFYQHVLAGKYRSHFNISNEVSHLNKMDDNEYVNHVKNLLLGKHNPENVILLEVEPEKQNTNIDFVATEKFTGIKSICISKLKREGEKLFYFNDGIKTPIYRIYNRVIFDEFIKRKDLQCEFNMTEKVAVEWAGHPNWFFRISKFTMPFLKSPFIPESVFLNELKEIPIDLENYVLKPLFSFSGSGVIFNVEKSDLTGILDPENWILQRKVNYEPVIQTPDGNVKTEIRMLYSWPKENARPELIINMARLSKGEMIGVKYNKNKTWVGGSVGFFENI